MIHQLHPRLSKDALLHVQFALIWLRYSGIYNYGCIENDAKQIGDIHEHQQVTHVYMIVKSETES
jgi:hypothetical protein